MSKSENINKQIIDYIEELNSEAELLLCMQQIELRHNNILNMYWEEELIEFLRVYSPPNNSIRGKLDILRLSIGLSSELNNQIIKDFREVGRKLNDALAGNWAIRNRIEDRIDLILDKLNDGKTKKSFETLQKTMKDAEQYLKDVYKKVNSIEEQTVQEEQAEEEELSESLKELEEEKSWIITRNIIIDPEQISKLPENKALDAKDIIADALENEELPDPEDDALGIEDLIGAVLENEEIPDPEADALGIEDLIGAALENEELPEPDDNALDVEDIIGSNLEDKTLPEEKGIDLADLIGETLDGAELTDDDEILEVDDQGCVWYKEDPRKFKTEAIEEITL